MNLEQYPLYVEAYKLLRISIVRLNRFPRVQRFGLAQRIQDHEHSLLELCVEAIYYPDNRKLVLKECNKIVAFLRILWRLSSDQGYISHKGYGAVVAQLEVIGKMVGGWLNKLSVTGNTQEAFS